MGSSPALVATQSFYTKSYRPRKSQVFVVLSLFFMSFTDKYPPIAKVFGFNLKDGLREAPLHTRKQLSFFDTKIMDLGKVKIFIF